MSLTSDEVGLIVCQHLLDEGRFGDVDRANVEYGWEITIKGITPFVKPGSLVLNVSVKNTTKLEDAAP